MKRAALYSTLLVMLVFFGGCKKQESDSDGIRAAIQQHLTSLKSLNLSAMDMNISSISIQGDQAQAQVEFRPKTGAPQGAGMIVAYTLKKQNGNWVVQNSAPAGGIIAHPVPGQNPHLNSTSPSSTSLPNFKDLVDSGSGSPLPAEHPPVKPQGNMPPQ
jgi:hypothetical protein